MSDCGRFQYLKDQACQHIPALSFNPFQIISFTILVFIIAFSTAGNFGSASVQIFGFVLLLNYGRKPMSTSIFLSSFINNLGKKHPKLNIPLIDFRLVIFLLPHMLTGLIAGIHFKDYIPPLIVSVFFVFQLGVLIFATKNKLRQIKSFEEMQKKVNEFTKGTDNMMDQCQIVTEEGVHLDFDQIFMKILKSPNKEHYLKHLPQDLRDFDININEEKIKVADFLNEKKYTCEQYEKIEEKLEKEQEIALKVPQKEVKLIVLFILCNVLVIGLSNRNVSIQQSCKQNYWNSFPIIMLINSIFFGVAIVFYKPGKVHLYKIIRATILALIGGFLLGLIGMGVSLFLILAIVKLNLSRGGMQSVGASLPVLLFSVNLAGTIISIITCAIANIGDALVIFSLGFVAQQKVNPILNEKIKQKQIGSKLTTGAILFQQTLMVLYIGMQLPKILRTPLIQQLTPIPYCD